MIHEKLLMMRKEKLAEHRFPLFISNAAVNYCLDADCTPFTQLLQTRVCFTNAGINTYGAAIHKVRKHAIHAFPSFLFLILLFRLYVKEPFSEIMGRQNGRPV